MTYQALAMVAMHTSDIPGLRSLIDELEGDRDGIVVNESLALALLDVCRKLMPRQGSILVKRIVELHSGAPGVRVLTTACGVLISKECFTEACDFYESRMEPRRFAPSAMLATSLLKAAAQAGRVSLAHRLSDHVGALRAAACQPSDSNSELSRHATMMKAYAREGDLKGAAAILRRLRETQAAPLTPLIYNCYLDACVLCGDTQAALAHFQEMKQLGCFDVVSYNTALKAYLAQGRNTEARRLVKEMGEHGFKPNVVTFHELLNSVVKNRDRESIWSLVAEMKAAGMNPTAVTCSILLKSLTPDTPVEDVKRVNALVNDIEEPADDILFTALIEACVRVKQLSLLSDVLRRYRENGNFMSRLTPTYGSVIKAYGHAGDVASVRQLWAQLSEQGVQPTPIMLGCMVEALVANGHADEAWDLVQEQLKDADLCKNINTVVYSTVLKGFAAQRRIDRVFLAYQEMRSRDILCNTITYNTMLDACAKCCAMNRAPGLLEDMKHGAVEPDIITYSTLVKGYCISGDIERAFQILEEMKGNVNFPPDEIVYNSILDGCAKQHRTDDAFRVLEDMKVSGIAPSNYTLSILVKLFGHARRLNHAFRMVEELSTQHGFQPNIQVYTCLAQACILNRRLERALALHDDVVAKKGCMLDEKFYQVFVSGCLQLHQPLKAIEVVRAAFRLPGHSLAVPARASHKPPGVGASFLADLAARLRSGGQEEQDALAKLEEDLLTLRGVRLGDMRQTGCSNRRRGGQGRRGGGGVGNGGCAEGSRGNRSMDQPRHSMRAVSGGNHP
eukprot:NODE_1079_length_2618_cov_2.315536.p1 GENE.NODE_1079_length_2618_cov_2.315536~~NODE_1079_length_2618_cov_2.315536.p1  ORF type:complete len:854 (+),score=277.78 NODE_1079_length_2618_cov_2.315536:195-2564(+)